MKKETIMWVLIGILFVAVGALFAMQFCPSKMCATKKSGYYSKADCAVKKDRCESCVDKAEACSACKEKAMPMKEEMHMKKAKGSH